MCFNVYLGPSNYLLMDFNVYLGPLVHANGATSISTISLVDVHVGSFSSYIYLPTHWTKHTKTTVWGAPSLENPSCSKLDFSPLAVAVVVVAVAAALPGHTLLGTGSLPAWNRRCAAGQPAELEPIAHLGQPSFPRPYLSPPWPSPSVSQREQ